MIATSVWSGSSAETRSSGIVAKLSTTLSSSSSTVSWVAAKLIVFDVSPALKMTLRGTPE